MLLYPHAKINLGLRILDRRSDGYHDIESLMLPIHWADQLSIEFASHQRVDQYLLDASCGPLEHNLVYRAVQLLRAYYSFPTLSIRLTKEIPMQAGLGGGSSDATFTLQGVNELCGLSLSRDTLYALSAQLGSDCPFFLYNTPAIAEGRGERLTPVSLPEGLRGRYLLLTKPPVAISTAEAYHRVTCHPECRGELQELLRVPLEVWRGRLINDFEEALYPEYDSLRRIHERHYEYGARYVSLSGSGSTIYGIYDEDPSALRSAWEPECQTWVEQIM